MKRILIGLCVGFMAIAASAENPFTNRIATGLTWVAAGASSNCVATAWVRTFNHDEVGVVVPVQYNTNDNNGAFCGVGIGVSNTTNDFTEIARVGKGPTGTTNTLARTNVYIGSWPYVGLTKYYNGCTNDAEITNNSYVIFQFKPTRDTPGN